MTDNRTGRGRVECVIGRRCAEHGYVHGSEAEELRKGLERLLAKPLRPRDYPASVRTADLQRLLDSIDARDSLAYLERKALAAGKRGE